MVRLLHYVHTGLSAQFPFTSLSIAVNMGRAGTACYLGKCACQAKSHVCRVTLMEGWHRCVLINFLPDFLGLLIRERISGVWRLYLNDPSVWVGPIPFQSSRQLANLHHLPAMSNAFTNGMDVARRVIPPTTYFSAIASRHTTKIFSLCLYGLVTSWVDTCTIIFLMLAFLFSPPFRIPLLK